MADGRFSRSYGGDTLNTAVYLARLGVAVDYVTALGDDPWSDEMIAGWAAEGIGTEQRGAPARPGAGPLHHPDRRTRRAALSILARQRAGPRAVRRPETSDIVDALAGLRPALLLGDHALALWRGGTRALRSMSLDRARAQGRRIAFDTNFRPRGWPDRALAQAAYRPRSTAPTSCSRRPKISSCCSAPRACKSSCLTARRPSSC